MRKLLRITAISAISILAVACKFDEPLSLRIMHVNDTHSYFDEKPMQVGLPGADGNLAPTYAYVGGYPRLARFAADSRAEASLNGQEFLLLHAGDAFTGSLYFTLFKGQLNADFMNYMQFDAMVLGNHEFDFGNQVLADFAKAVHFPLISANVKTSRGGALHGLYLPLTIKMVGNKPQPVAIVGLTTPDTALISSPSDTTVFKDSVTAARRTVERLTAHGVNKIVFLTHQGLEADKALAAAVPGIDVIIGGHSHTLLGDHRNVGLPYSEPSPVMASSPTGEPVCIMQSGEHSLVAGLTEIEFSGPGLVESCVGQNTFLVGDIFARGTPPKPVGADEYRVILDYISAAPNVEVVERDPAAQDMLNAARLQVEAFAATEIGVTAEPLYHVRLPGNSHPEAGELEQGSMVAPHVALSMAFQMEQTTGEPYIGMMNAGGVRADLAGSVTVGDAYTVLPFASTLVSMSMSGAELVAELQRNINNAYAISGVTFPYVANLRYTLDLVSPQAPDVRDVMVKAADGSFNPIDVGAEYNVVTTSYLAGGGDGYSFIGAEAITDTGHVDADVFSKYVQAQPGGVLNRISSGIALTE